MVPPSQFARYPRNLDLGAVNLPEICLLSLHYPPEPTGSAPYSGALAAGLAASGYKVVAHVGHPHYPEWRVYPGYSGWRCHEIRDGVEVVRRRHYVPQPPRGVRRLFAELSFGLRIAFARWNSPSVVIATSPTLFSTAAAVLRLRIARRPPGLIVWVQDIYSVGLAETGQGGEVVQRITRWVERHTLSAADRVVVIHPRFAHVLTEELGVPASKVVVVRNWTHLRPSEVVDRTAAKAELGWPTDVSIAVHAGNMGAKQGLENVVDAARIAESANAPVLFLLIGEGSERRKLELYSRGISQIRFIDPLDDEEFRLALRAADVLIVNEQPGLLEMSVPSKLTSYFDAGRPIVAAANSSGTTASEIALANAGVVVPAGDPSALLCAVAEMARDAVTAERYGLNGRRYRDACLSESQALRDWRRVIASVAPHQAR